MTPPRFPTDAKLLLRAALAPRAAATEAARTFLAEFDPETYLDPRAYAAVPAVYTRLGKDAALHDPHWTLLAGVARQIWTRNQVRLAAVRTGFTALERVGAEPLVVPGAVTAMATLESSGARLLEGIDLLIQVEHVPRVTAALLAAGASISGAREPLLNGYVAEHGMLSAALTDAALAVRWGDATAERVKLDAFRTRSESMSVGSLPFTSLAPADGLVVVLGDLVDTDPGPTGWTNQILELARLRRRVGKDGQRIEDLAHAAHDAGRHDAWAEQLRMVAYLSGDADDDDAAERFAAAPPPFAFPALGSTTSVPERSAPRRALRMVHQYRAAAATRNEPVTIRGLARFLEARWHLTRARDLLSEVGRRLARARRPTSPS
jgi:hypothetical protein